MIPNLVQPVPYTNAAASPIAIIPEVLKENNYERWSILMRHYLMAQGLWDDVILSSQIPLAKSPEDWIKKNASALFAIKISCGAEKFEQIKMMNSAKDAWDALASLHKPPNADKHGGSETDNDKLLTIRNKKGYIPLVVACSNRKKDMSSYLYSVTPPAFFLRPENSDQGTLFLKNCVLNVMFDVGLDLFLRCPQLAASTTESITISELSENPSLLPSRAPVDPLELLLSKCLFMVKLPSPSENTDGSRKKIFRIRVAWIKVLSVIPIVQDIYTHVYNLKLTRMYANSVLQNWCKKISTYKGATQLVESGTISAIFQAIKDGTLEIVIEILKSNPDLIWCNENLSREILISAIKYRRGGILGFVLRLDAGKKTFLSLTDEDGNNVLHLVAKLPDFRIYVTLSPAWFMQQEEVRSLLPRWYGGAKNHYGQTPSQVFDVEHQQLTKEANDWAKKTADSFILVPVLIVTIMFAAIFTVPGGNNQETGIPILLHTKLFSGFLVCDVVSLFTASISMLLFLIILTESYDTFGLRRTLSWYFQIAMFLLIISIVTMTLGFVFALTIMLPRVWLVVLAILLPYYVFNFTSLWIFPTAVDVYGPMLWTI
ncbi:hypothetical protein SLEP1_g25173 [Rubroshorea leprosula]|uniref:PGG domain-containing protein n=1 Tax=Rubroshorea leprosula TaxID=152421 RepID=A0AAV5JI39_9ROSI|nr:hypothetical protein SLEP1_g25173 [Rubroshorea leprosula]